MRKLFLFISMLIIWMLLVWPFNPVKPQDIIAGMIISGLIVFFIGKGKTANNKILEIHRYLWALKYIPVLIFYMILANLDVLYRVFHPAMPINPGIVKIKTGLKSSWARAILCNSITLTPGTLTIDIIDDSIYVHWINVKDGSADKITEIIAGKFEVILKRVFE